jgi:hypothetical protein
LRSIRVLASYLSKAVSYEIALSTLESFGDEAARMTQSTVYYLILATLHAYGDNIKEALMATEGQSTLELSAHLSLLPSLIPLHRSAYAIQLLLRMDRVDLAQQRLALMKSVDEESALTQLAMAWVNMRLV